MKLKVPKTERKRSSDSRLKRFFRRALIVAVVLALLGLAGTHLFALITGNETLAIPEEGVSRRLMHRSRVLLPEPEAPMTEVTSPFFTVKSISLSTSWVPKLLDRWFTCKIA